MCVVIYFHTIFFSFFEYNNSRRSMGNIMSMCMSWIWDSQPSEPQRVPSECNNTVMPLNSTTTKSERCEAFTLENYRCKNRASHVVIDKHNKYRYVCWKHERVSMPMLVCRDEECCICLENLYSQPYRLRQLACRHVFHDRCVQQWIEKSCASGSAHCPVCRFPVLKHR